MEQQPHDDVQKKKEKMKDDWIRAMHLFMSSASGVLERESSQQGDGESEGVRSYASGLLATNELSQQEGEEPDELCGSSSGLLERKQSNQEDEIVQVNARKEKGKERGKEESNVTNVTPPKKKKEDRSAWDWPNLQEEGEPDKSVDPDESLQTQERFINKKVENQKVRQPNEQGRSPATEQIVEAGEAAGAGLLGLDEVAPVLNSLKQRQGIGNLLGSTNLKKLSEVTELSYLKGLASKLCGAVSSDVTNEFMAKLLGVQRAIDLRITEDETNIVSTRKNLRDMCDMIEKYYRDHTPQGVPGNVASLLAMVRNASQGSASQ